MRVCLCFSIFCSKPHEARFIRKKPELLLGSLSFLKNEPGLLDFENKRNLMRTLLTNPDEATRNAFGLVAGVRATRVVERSRTKYLGGGGRASNLFYLILFIFLRELIKLICDFTYCIIYPLSDVGRITRPVSSEMIGLLLLLPFFLREQRKLSLYVCLMHVLGGAAEHFFRECARNAVGLLTRVGNSTGSCTAWVLFLCFGDVSFFGQ